MRMGFVILLLAASMLAASPSDAIANIGALKVTSFPSGAQITIDGVLTGKVTPVIIPLEAGNHVVTVIAGAGWSPVVRTVTITTLGITSLDVTLLPALTVGPPGATGVTGPR